MVSRSSKAARFLMMLMLGPSPARFPVPRRLTRPSHGLTHPPEQWQARPTVAQAEIVVFAPLRFSTRQTALKNPPVQYCEASRHWHSPALCWLMRSWNCFVRFGQDVGGEFEFRMFRPVWFLPATSPCHLGSPLSFLCEPDHRRRSSRQCSFYSYRSAIMGSILVARRAGR
jgi:hypothetical protein